MTLQEQKLAHLCDLCKMDLKGEYTLSRMAERVKDFDVDEFIDFIESAKNRADLQFVSKGYDTFLKFCEMYNRERNAHRIEKAHTASYRLAQKVRDVKGLVKQHGIDFGYHNLRQEGRPYFTSYETATLSKIGTLRQVCMIDDNMQLEDRIEKEFMKTIFVENKVKQVENKVLKIGNKLNMQIKTM